MFVCIDIKTEKSVKSEKVLLKTTCQGVEHDMLFAGAVMCRLYTLHGERGREGLL